MRTKTKMLSIATFVAVALTAGWNYQQNKVESELSDLALENIEALANNEGSSMPCTGPKTSITGTCKCQNDKPCKDNRGCY